MKQRLSEIIYHLLEQKHPTSNDLKKIKRVFSKKYVLRNMPSNIDILKVYREMLRNKQIEKSLDLEKVLKKRAIRSQSGIVAVQVLTKPFPCSGECIFCPNDPEMPKSYIKSEPGAMRAHLNKFDSLEQVYNRLYSLSLGGHPIDKIEMIVLGGTRDFYPEKYKIEFIKGLYDACNTFDQLDFVDKLERDLGNKDSKTIVDVAGQVSSELQYVGKKKSKYAYSIKNLEHIEYSKNIDEAIKLNETATNRVIGLTIETRPEFVNDANCKKRRKLGVTRLEIGVQSMYNEILLANKRGHSVQAVRNALHKLRQYGFKFTIHVMPGLYKSNYKKDIGTMRKIYEDPFVKPDEIKLYPTSVIPNTKLNTLYQQGKYKALKIATIKKLIKESFLEIIPPYTRIKRLIRDIPSNEIQAGSNVTNLAQLVHDKMKEKMKKNVNLRKDFYQRLYRDYRLVKSMNRFLSLIQQTHLSKKKGGLDTIIIGKKPQLVEYRNFVSLDTRSREIRHKESSACSNPLTTIKNISQKSGKLARKHADDISGFSRDLKKVGGGMMLLNPFRKVGLLLVGLSVLLGKTYKRVHQGLRYMQQGEQLGEKYGKWPKKIFDWFDDQGLLSWMGKQSMDIPNLVCRQYQSSVGKEIFLSFEDRQGYLYGFARLLLPQKSQALGWSVLQSDTAIIRELHIYGQVAHLNKQSDERVLQDSQKQHKGLGTQLMDVSEIIAQGFGYRTLAVISGVGVRKYYERLGYRLVDTYMVKDL